MNVDEFEDGEKKAENFELCLFKKNLTMLKFFFH